MKILPRILIAVAVLSFALRPPFAGAAGPGIIGGGGVVTRFYSIAGQPKWFFRSRRN